MFQGSPPVSARRPLAYFALLFLLVATIRADEAQTQLTDVASVPFGASQKQAVLLFNDWARSRTFSITVPLGWQTADKFRASGGAFAGIDVSEWAFSFARDSLYEVIIVFRPRDDMAIIDTVSALLAEKYGPAKRTSRDFHFPYNLPFRSLDLEAKKEAFSKSKAEYSSFWQLRNGTISCRVDHLEGEGLVTWLRYFHSGYGEHATESLKRDL